MNTENIIEQLPFWNRLNDLEKRGVFSASSIVKYKDNSLITVGDFASLGMFYVVSGTVRVCMVSRDGREITLYKVSAGESCVIAAGGMLEAMTLNISAIADGDVEMLVVGKKAYDKLEESNIYVRCFTYEIITSRLSSALWVMYGILFRRFDVRLATYLTEECDRIKTCELHATQETIAREVNSAREVVARTLKQFSLESLVEVKRGYIIIKNVDELRELARD